MKTFAQKVLASLPSQGLDYADVRVTGQHSENIATKNGNVEAVTKNSDSGFGLRVLAGDGRDQKSCQGRHRDRQGQRPDQGGKNRTLPAETPKGQLQNPGKDRSF
jgi:hypothetical protein